ncbi:N-term cysteine-rich ER, FAM69 [Popillia japonica]|uniref:N-term cysteine-rich ER, FAM69 n=1 Tax=Popillia japonica TaxID=7064 RepID=A0AAW1MBA1_POPJA
MLLLRRLPGILYTHRYSFYTGIVLFVTFAYLLFRWNLICSNIQAWQHINKACTKFANGFAVGSLCIPLCATQDIHTITCHSFQSTKEAVFSAEWHDTRLVFKSATSYVNVLHWYDNGELKYPSERDFLYTVKAIVKNKINMNISHDTAQKLARLKPSYQEINLGKRRREMDNLWVLLQDNEYLLSALYAERDIFPQLLGTCGTYFAVEFVEPIESSPTTFLSISDNRKEWGRRLKIALLILELLDELETGFHEPYHLCDIKLEHFGLTRSGNKVKFLDLVSVYSKSIVGAIIRQIGACQKDEDCEYLDCRGKCEKRTRQCSTVVNNNNFQIVCEKIFLGWRMSNTILIPGLLMSQHTPSDLAALLRQCANPDMETGKPRMTPSEDLRKRLYNILIEMEQSVNEDIFLK